MKKQLLYTERWSSCHHAPCLIVRSRKGGLATQNCIMCGEPAPLSLDEIPKFKCEECHHLIIPFINHYKTYAFCCDNCGASYLLGDLVPHWDEYFEEHGFGIPPIRDEDD